MSRPASIRTSLVPGGRRKPTSWSKGAGTIPREGGAPDPRLEILPPSELADRAARAVGDAISGALEERGRCAIALSGGATPAFMFARLAIVDLAWNHVDVFQVDERVAPDSSAARNLSLIERQLVDRIAGEAPRIHPMPVGEEDLVAAADRYATELEDVCGRPPSIDVVHLGLGEDGHTASLVPGDPALGVRDRSVTATGSHDGYRRLTLTYPTLERSGTVVFLVTGAEKASALAGMLEGDATLPVSRLRPRDSVIFADPAAARLVSGERLRRPADGPGP